MDRRRLTAGPAAAAIALAVLAAACQPLPHPFAEDIPPPGLLTVRDTIGVTVAPIDGEPVATAAKLGAAMARALQEHDIAATEQTTSLGSYQLYGRVVAVPRPKNKASIVAYWRLRDPSGRPIGERKAQIDVPVRAWQDGAADAVASLAAASATQLAGLLLEEPPKEAAGGGRIRVRVRKVEGAPGDGRKSLAVAIASVLKRQDLEIVTDPKGKADLYVDADVVVAGPKGGKQNVKIVWHVRRPDGSEIGTVGEENDVPSGLLNGPWGDVAYMVAISAGNGILQLVDRGAPAPDRKS
ncbi:MAG: hypothetical protein JO305_09925 [Alphaproteobacteria bacterium]|nr:hypothetical protein [Alphaproteobacteria bacterium]